MRDDNLRKSDMTGEEQSSDSMIRGALSGIVGLADALKRTRLDARQAEMVELLGQSCTMLLKALQPEPANRAPGPAPQQPGQGQRSGTMRVLLAEDHPVNQRVVSLMLEPAGAEVVVAANGLEAVALFSQEAFDVVLMDMAMPEMDGLEATRLIRKYERDHKLERTPIAMLSANSMPEHKAAASKAGCDGHIAKPVTITELLTGIEAAVQAASATWDQETKAA